MLLADHADGPADCSVLQFCTSRDGQAGAHPSALGAVRCTRGFLRRGILQHATNARCHLGFDAEGFGAEN
jgi:hypothetical protein